MNQFDIIDAFTNAMRTAGIDPEFKHGQGIEFGLAPGSKPHRFHVKGDSKGSRNGWYILFADGIPAGEFGSWKNGHRETWCAKGGHELTEHERDAIRQRMEETQRARETAIREREGEAARNANLIWNAACEAPNDHPYLMRKGIRSHGLRVCTWPLVNADGEQWGEVENALLVPIMNAAGKIMSLQAIYPAKRGDMGRDKDFLPGGKKKGGMHIIGGFRSDRPVVICEGYATGATIHEVTGWTVAVAFDAGNLPAVAMDLREDHGAYEFIIAADNDQWTHQPVENPGVHFAERASAGARARVVVPQFADLDGRPTDFNDLAVREGDDVVQRQLMPPVRSLTVIDVDADGDVVEYFDPRSVDGFTPFPVIDAKGKPKPTIANLTELLSRANITCRYNMCSKDLEITIPGKTYSRDNKANAVMTDLVDICETIDYPTKNLETYMLNVGEANKYHPVAEWIESRAWDGVSRLQEFYDTVTARSDKELIGGGSLKELLMRKWLISAVAAVFQPDHSGFMTRGVLTFQSEQNLGKTLWVKRLAPRELRCIRDGLILDPANKDSVMAFASNWIVELGEVDATFKKADIAALKGFISMECDKLRRPYGRTESEYPRRTVVFASVNDEQFLHDPTGNTRWWTIPVIALNNQHTIDVQQLWAEVKSLYDAGEVWHLTKDELTVLGEQNSDHEAINPVHDMIDRAFNWSSPMSTWTRGMRATEICLAAGIEKPSKTDVNAAGAFVCKRYGVVKKKHGKERQNMWMMPEGRGSPL